MRDTDEHRVSSCDSGHANFHAISTRACRLNQAVHIREEFSGITLVSDRPGDACQNKPTGPGLSYTSDSGTIQ